jgi:hypothetical protein
MGDSRTVDQRSNCRICSSASAITFGPETQSLGTSSQQSSLPCLICVRNETRQLAVKSRKHATCLSNVVTYLKSNVELLKDYRTWQRVGGRISTGFIESSINRIVRRQMCKSQHMCWSRVGAHSVVHLRVALLNQEFHELARRQFPWIGQRRVTWPWQRTSQGF